MDRVQGELPFQDTASLNLVPCCLQSACLKYVTNDKMTNLTLRERLGIDKQNYPMASRIIKDTLIAGKIKEEKTENQSRNNKGYVPFWA